MTYSQNSISQQLRDYYSMFPVDESVIKQCREQWSQPVERTLLIDLTHEQDRLQAYFENRANNNERLDNGL